MMNEEKANLCVVKLKALDKDRLAAQLNLELCGKQMSSTLNFGVLNKVKV